MKKILFFLSFFLFSVLTYGQHLSVKGVEINGPADAFIAQMKAKGFEYVSDAKTDGTTVLKGTFAGYKNSYVFVYHDNNLVSKVSILLPGFENWKDVKADYLSLKEAYTEKYHADPKSIERFTDDYQEFSGIEYIYLNNGQAEYVSLFTVDGGMIQLSIKYFDETIARTLWPGSGFTGKYAVAILYVDEENESAKQELYIDDL